MNDPPVLKITSPKRSLIQDGAGRVTVTGTVTPNELSAEPVEKVLVNNVQATLNADGSFTVMSRSKRARRSSTPRRVTPRGKAPKTRARFRPASSAPAGAQHRERDHRGDVEAGVREAIRGAPAR